jgi:hypothetical protein
VKEKATQVADDPAQAEEIEIKRRKRGRGGESFVKERNRIKLNCSLSCSDNLFYDFSFTKFPFVLAAVQN